MVVRLLLLLLCLQAEPLAPRTLTCVDSLLVGLLGRRIGGRGAFNDTGGNDRGLELVSISIIIRDSAYTSSRGGWLLMPWAKDISGLAAGLRILLGMWIGFALAEETTKRGCTGPRSRSRIRTGFRWLLRCPFGALAAVAYESCALRHPRSRRLSDGIIVVQGDEAPGLMAHRPARPGGIGRRKALTGSPQL